MSVLLRLAYDGTEFHGYAQQRPRPDGSPVRTVQGELERSLANLYKQKVESRAASRTDAGVHAQGQLVAFEPPMHIPMPGLVRGLNAQLPADVVAIAAWERAGEVDVRRGNAGKYYRYRVRCTEVADPLHVRYEWHLARRLDPYAMKEAAAQFVGSHDFAGFRASGCQATTTIREVDAVEVTYGASALGPMSDPGRLDVNVHTGAREHGPASAWGPDWVEFHVWGKAFLMNMVRIMVGTLVDVGLGRRPAAEIKGLLAKPDRQRAGMTAPPRGLTLVEVSWRDEAPADP